jgi:hypothetical protein
MRRSATAVLLSLVLAALSLAVPLTTLPAANSADTSYAEARGGVLKVKIVKPARKQVATVVVKGPDGFRRELHETTKLTGLAPGRYRISGQTVRTRKWYSKPTVSVRSVKVRTGKTVRTRVSYWTVISTRAKVLKGRAIESYQAPTAEPGSTGTMVLDKPMPVGAILAAGITRNTPAGALAEVVSVKKAGGDYVHTVTLASLQEAVPRGEYVGTWDFEDPTDPGAARFAGRRAGGCTGSLNGGAEINGGAKFAAEFNAHWNWTKSYVSATLSADAWVKFAAWAEAKGTCTTGDKTLVSTDLAYIAFAIGPIPVVLVPHLDVSVGASISAQGRLQVDAVAKAHAAVVAKVGLGGGEISGEGPDFEGTSSVTVYASAQADAYAKARLSMLLYKVAGPWMQARMGAQAKADSTANPWWTVDAVLEGGAGVTVGGCLDLWIKKFCLKVEKSDPALLKGEFRITQADGSYPKYFPASNGLTGPHTQIPKIEPPPFVIGKHFTHGDDVHITSGGIEEIPGFVAGTASQDKAGAEGPNDMVHDPTTLTATVIPEFDRLRIPFVFATEEEPGSHQDGAVITVGGTKCAEVSADDATISNGDQHLDTRYDHVTPVQLCDVPVVPHQPVEVVITVFDTWNGLLDSGIAITGDHISSYDG